jgi:hypothetical protein
LASLTVGQAHLDGSTPFLELAAADEKNRQGSQIPLRADLAAELGEWLKERSQRLRGNATIAMPCKPAVGLLKAESESVRLAAAKSVVELGCRLREAGEFEQRLSALEGKAANGQFAKSPFAARNGVGW